MPSARSKRRAARFSSMSVSSSLTADCSALYPQRRPMTTTIQNTTSWMTWTNQTWRTTGRTGRSRSPVGVRRAWRAGAASSSVPLCSRAVLCFREGGERAAGRAVRHSECVLCVFSLGVWCDAPNRKRNMLSLSVCPRQQFVYHGCRELGSLADQVTSGQRRWS